MNSKTKQFLWFTLVELIVVITIVWILSTVWFVSYSGYLTGARDSNRISQLTKLSDSLQVYSASKTLPLPDDNIQITASWELVWYQGFIWVDVLETIDYTNGWKDPKDDAYYTYYLTKDRNSLQLMAMMEESWSIAMDLTQQVNAANYEDRFPKVYGRKLWVLTYNDTADLSLINTPAQEITANAAGLDVVSTPVVYTAHISDSWGDKITGTWWVLTASIPNGSCRRIKQTWGAWDNGKYTILLAGNELEVYCDMDTSWGGWTLLKKWVSWSAAYNDNLNDPSVAYALSYPRYDDLYPSEYMQATFNGDFDIVEFVEYDEYTDNINFDWFTSANIVWSNAIWDNGMLFSK